MNNIAMFTMNNSGQSYYGLQGQPVFPTATHHQSPSIIQHYHPSHPISTTSNNKRNGYIGSDGNHIKNPSGGRRAKVAVQTTTTKEATPTTQQPTTTTLSPSPANTEMKERD